MTEEDLNTLRTKALLLGIATVRVQSISSDPWAVVFYGTTTFMFKADEHRRFYASEAEALKDGIRLKLAGEEETEHKYRLKV